MLDFPMQYNKQQNIAQEYTVEPYLQYQTNLYALSETDLSFYDSLGAGLCSGASSSRQDPTKSIRKKQDI